MKVLLGLKLVGLKLLCVGEYFSYFSEVCFKDVMTQNILITWYLWYVLRYHKVNSLSTQIHRQQFLLQGVNTRGTCFYSVIAMIVHFFYNKAYLIPRQRPHAAYTSNQVFKCFRVGIIFFPHFSLIINVQINPFTKH